LTAEHLLPPKVHADLFFILTPTELQLHAAVAVPARRRTSSGCANWNYCSTLISSWEVS
jgi:hypothetical protein